MKPFWKSKTIWASALSFAAYALATAGVNAFVKTLGKE